VYSFVVMIYRLDSQAFHTERGDGQQPSSTAPAAAAHSPAALASAAAEVGDEETIAAFLRSAAHDPDTRNPQTGHTLLWTAALGGHAGVVRLLAVAGANYTSCYFNIDDPFTGTTVWRQCSPLWLSVHCGHTTVTKLLLDLGADPCHTNQPFRMAECHGGRESRARTPLFHACCIGNLEAVSLLAGLVDINATNAHDGLSAFWASACMGHEPICRLLYAAGADPYSTPHRSTHAAHVGASSLWVACEQGRTEVVELLASLGLHDEEAERLENHPRGTAEDAARCNSHGDILAYLKLLREVEPTKSLCGEHNCLRLHRLLVPRAEDEIY
jgi:ankyrin repeat protein